MLVRLAMLCVPAMSIEIVLGTRTRHLISISSNLGSSVTIINMLTPVQLQTWRDDG